MGEISMTVVGKNAVEQGVEVLESTTTDASTEIVEITIGEPEKMQVGSGYLKFVGKNAVEQAIEVLESTEFGDQMEIVDIMVTDADSLNDTSRKTSKTGIIQRNTSHHSILHQIAKINNEGDDATSRKILQVIDRYPESTIRPGISALYDRGLTKREPREWGQGYIYELSSEGRKILNDFGRPH